MAASCYQHLLTLKTYTLNQNRQHAKTNQKSLSRAYVLWVAREYRTNPLSHEEGGSDVVVEYHSDEVFGYDWIKFPSKYVSAIFYKRIDVDKEDFEVYDEDEQLTTIKDEIKSIYARKWSSMEDHDKVPFEEV